MDQNGRTICQIFLFAVFLISGCTILGVSFAVIEPTEVGLYYNPNTKFVWTNEVWKNGRHMVCPGCSFIKFPTNLQLFEYSYGPHGYDSLSCWTRDKQELTIEVYVQVKIKSEEVGQIWEKYMNGWHDVWKKIITMAVKQTTKSFDTVQFFEERAEILTALDITIRSFLEPEGVEVVNVYVGQVTIPGKFEDAVTTKVVTQQNAQTVLMERNVTLIESETNIIQAEANADATIILGEAAANADVIRERAAANGTKIVQMSEALGLKELSDDLSMDVEKTLRYKFSRMLKELGGQTEISVGFEGDFLGVKDRA